MVTFTALMTFTAYKLGKMVTFTAYKLGKITGKG